MADEHLLSTRQQQLVLAVVEALNHGADDIHAWVRAAVTPRPEPTDIAAVQRIVALDWVDYTPGEKPAVILARLLDRIEAITDPAGHQR